MLSSKRSTQGSNKREASSARQVQGVIVDWLIFLLLYCFFVFSFKQTGNLQETCLPFYLFRIFCSSVDTYQVFFCEKSRNARNFPNTPLFFYPPPSGISDLPATASSPASSHRSIHPDTAHTEHTPRSCYSQVREDLVRERGEGSRVKVHLRSSQVSALEGAVVAL